MKGLILSLLLISLSLAVSGQYCMSGLSRLIFQFDYNIDLGQLGSVESRGGYVQLCVNQYFYSICTGNGGVDEEDLADRICSSMGYTNSSYEASQFVRSNSSIIDRVNCSSSYSSNSLYGCVSNLTNVESCDPSTDLFVVCSRFIPNPNICTVEGSYRLANISNFNGSSVVVGVPQICYNGLYRSVCPSVINDMTAHAFCGGNSTTSGTPGSLFGPNSAYNLTINNPDSSNYITAIDCLNNNYTDTENCFVNVSDSCPENYNGVVTCRTNITSTCSPGSTRRPFYRTEYFLTRTVRTFLLETCSPDGQYVSFCSSDTNTSYIARLACNDQDSRSAEAIVVDYDPLLHGTYTDGLYATNISCYSDGLYSCNYDITSTCNGGPLIVQCRPECDNNAARLVNGTTYSLANGTLAYSGVLEVCTDGEWSSVCDDGSLTSNGDMLAIQAACSSLQYTGGSILSRNSPYYRTGSMTDNVLEVNCSSVDYFYSFSQCQSSLSNDSFCDSHNNDLVVQCVAPNTTCYGSYDTNFRTQTSVTFSNGTSVSIGYASFCDDNSYSTVCDNVLSNETAASDICTSTYYQIGYPFPLYGSAMDYYPRLSNTGLYNYTCPYYTNNIQNCGLNFTDNGTGCTQYGGPALISCQSDMVCGNNNMRLANRGSGRFSNGSYIYIGRPEICINGTYVPVCANTVNQTVAQALCYNTVGYSDSYSYDYSILNIDNFFDSVNGAGQVIINYTCQYNYGYGYCDFGSIQTANVSTCDAYGGDSVITCTSISSVPPTPACITGQYRLSQRVDGNVAPGIPAAYSLLEICVNGTYYRVCANSSEATIDGNVGNLVCASNGFSGSHITPIPFPSQTEAVITSITCPPSTTNLTNCSYSLSTEGTCAEHSSDVFLTCFGGPSVCNGSGLSLLGNQTQVLGNFVQSTGVPAQCFNGSYVTLCNDGTITQDVTDIFCNELGYESGFLMNGNTSFAAVPNGTVYLSNFVCPIGASQITDCDGNATQCSSDSAFLLTCYRTMILPPCEREGGYLLNNVTGIAQGFNYTVGLPVQCFNGTYISLCNDGTITQDFTNAFCYSLGFEFSLLQQFNSTLYGTLPPNTFYYTNLTCPDGVTDIAQCDGVFTQCPVGAGAVLSCANPARVCEGSGFSIINSYNSISSGYNVTTGLAAECSNNTYVSLCNDGTITQDIASLFCSSLGYEFGVLQQFNSTQFGSLPNSTVFLSNLTCPIGAIDLSPCDGDITQCPVGNSSVVSCISRVRVCEGDSYSLFNASSVVAPGINTTTAIPVRCENGSYSVLCGNDGSVSSLEVYTLCTSLGFDIGGMAISGNSTQYGTLPNGTLYYTNFTCPILPDDLNECEADQVSPSYCSNGGVLIIECYKSAVIPECVPGQTTLYEPVNGTMGSTSYVSGQALVCVDGVFTPICNSTSLGTLEILNLCLFEGLFGGYVGTPDGVSVSMYNMTERVVTNVSCGGVLNCSNSTGPGNNCPAYTTVTCQSVCDDEAYGVQLFGSALTLPINGTNVTIGVPQTCVGGALTRVCNDGTNFPLTAYLFCRSLGFSVGMMAPYDPLIYNELTMNSPSGILYLSNFSCNDQFEDCNGNYSSNASCYGGQRDLVIQCAGASLCDGTGVSLNFNQTTLANGHIISTGIPSRCEMGNLLAICNDPSFADSTANLFCRDLGYEFGYPLRDANSSQYGILPEGTTYFTNYTCPNNASSTDNCDAQFTNDPLCLSGQQSLVLQCYRRAPPVCVSGSVQLLNSTSVYSNGSIITTGLAAQCINGSYVTLCNDGTIMQSVSNLFCNVLGFESGSIQPSNTSYGNVPGGSTYLTNFTCPPNTTDTNLCDGNYSTNTQCLAGQLNYILQCTRRLGSTCFNGDVRLSNNNTSNMTQDRIIYNSLMGAVEICVNGSYRPVCGLNNATLNASRLVELACDRFGYYDGSRNFTGTSPQINSSIIDMANCSSDAMFPSECSFSANSSNSSACYNYGQSVYATCTRGTGCTGTGPILFNNVTTVGNGYIANTGIPTECTNGTLTALCLDDTISTNLTSFYCQLLGYDYGMLETNVTSYELGGVPQNTEFITNVTCPFNSVNLSSCDGNDTYCSMVAVISCIRITATNSSSIVVQPSATVSQNISMTVSQNISMTPTMSQNISMTPSMSINVSITPSQSINVSMTTLSLNISTMTPSTSFNITPTFSSSFSSSIMITATPSPSPSPSTPTLQRCYSRSDAQFGANTSNFYFNNIRLSSGVVEVCSDDYYRPVCRDALNDTFARLFCQSVQYNSVPDYTIVLGDENAYTSNYNEISVVYNIASCNYGSLYYCGYNVTNDTCDDYGGLAVLTCRQIPSPQVECSSSSVSLTNVTSVNYYTSETRSTGRATFCRNNQLVDICADSPSANMLAQSACNNQFSGSRAMIVPYSSQYLSSPSGITLTNVTCNSDYLGSCSYGINDTCNADILTVMCYRECQSYNSRLVNQRVDFTSNGSALVSGLLEVCINNNWTAVCDDGLLTQDFANAACRGLNLFGLQGGTFLDYNSTLYGVSTTSAIWTDFNCTNYGGSTYLGDCFNNAMLSNSSECTDRESDAVLQCFKPARRCDYENNEFYYSTRYTRSDGTQATIGRLETCLNDQPYYQYASYCNNTINSPVIDRVCSRGSQVNTGRSYPIVGTLNDYGVSLASLYITGISCPDDGFNIRGCNFTTATSCDGFGENNIVTCFQGPYTCSPGYVSIPFSASGDINGVSINTGYVQGCQLVDYIPVCRDGISNQSLQYLCYRQRGYTGYSIGPVVGNASNYTQPSHSQYVATSVSCPVFSRYDDCVYEREETTCDNRGGFVLVTCTNIPTMCNHGDVRIAGGPNNYTGRPEFCYFGTWRTICGDGYDQPDAAVTCSLAGFNHELAVNLTAGSYGNNSLPPVLAGLRCTGREGSFSNCTPINGDLLNSCSAVAAVACEPVIVELNTTINGTISTGPNTNTSLTCNVGLEYFDGNFTINSLGWYRNGNMLNNVTGRYYITRRNVVQQRCSYYYNGSDYFSICNNYTVSVMLVLSFDNLMTSDSGDYICRVNVTNLNYSRTVVNTTTETLLIPAPPTITTGPMNLTTLNNTNVSFNCTIQSTLSPMIQWLYALPPPTQPQIISFKLLNDDDRYTINTVMDSSEVYISTLMVPNAIFRDTGRYRCLAMNSAGGPVHETANLVVLVPPTVTVSTASGSTNIDESQSVILTCSAVNSFPALPTLSWFSNDGNLLTTGGRITVTTNTPTRLSSGLYTTMSTLNISSVRSSDQGTYECRTPSLPPLFPSLSREISITVQIRNECLNTDQSSRCANGYCIDEYLGFFCVCPDTFIGTLCETPVTANELPLIINPPTEQIVPLGSSVNLSCVTTGAPQPVITWFRDNDVLTGANLPFYIINSITITDRGYYRCSATNSEGSVESSAVLVSINNVVQYSSVLSTTSSRRKRETFPPAVQAALNASRESLVGTQVSPGVTVAAIDISAVGAEFHLIFTLQLAMNSMGELVSTAGVTGSLNTVLQDFAMDNPGISFAAVTRFDGCATDTLSVGGGSTLSITWPESSIGQLRNIICPCGNLSTTYGASATRRCTGDFTTPGVWSGANSTQCVFNAVTTSLCAISENNDLGELNTIIEPNTQAVTSIDLSITSEIITDSLDDAIADPTVLEDLLDVFNNVLDIPSTVLQESQAQNNATESLLNAIETLGANLPISGDNVALIRTKFAITATSVSRTSFTGTRITASLSATGTLDGDSLSSSSSRTPVIDATLPDNLFSVIDSSLTDVRIASNIYTDASLFQSRNSSTTVQSISAVVSIDVYSGGNVVPVTGLTGAGIRINIMLSSTTTVSNDIRCATWNTRTKLWDTEGVTTTTNDNGGYTCVSTHLSSYSLVEDRSIGTTQPPTIVTAEIYEREPILFVGLLIAMIVIVIAVISHLLSDAQRHCPEGRIFMSSHITLFILYLVFVLATGASFTTSTGFCGVFSGLFHFFSMIYFMWLLIEGLFYVIKLHMGIGSNVFTRHYFVISLIIAIAIPLVIVIISAAAGHDYYVMEDSLNMGNYFCRPHGGLFYYGYVLPMVIMYLLTCVSYLLSFVLICFSGMTTAEKQFRKDAVLPHFYAGLILALIFALIWVFALVATQSTITGAGSTALQYIFGFLAIGHSIVLLVLSFLRTKDTRSFWQTGIRKLPGRSGQYDFASTEETAPGGVRRRGTQEAYGLDTSGKYMTDISGKNLGTDEEKKPLADGNEIDGGERYVTTTMIEKETEAMGTASTVVVNEDAIITDDEENKKTEL